VTEPSAVIEWPDQEGRHERGAIPVIRLFASIALMLGRPTARRLLYPICLYFLIFSGRSRDASRDYLARVFGRTPRIVDLFRHYYCFAACVLDRVYLLNNRLDLLDLAIHGENVVLDVARSGSGCFLLGAHIGSFEILRAVGRRQPNLRISMVMREENARKINSVLNAISPDLAIDVISLGRSNSLLEVEERLSDGHFVGVLADRGSGSEAEIRLPFLGTPAAFPVGPFRMMAVLDRPVVLMFGLYRGGRRYDIYFERLIDLGTPAPRPRAKMVEAAMRRYVERLEHYCRLAPYNWFNFYRFWN
jgi:predicted LPLAT superfamily acyltransferase